MRPSSFVVKNVILSFFVDFPHSLTCGNGSGIGQVTMNPLLVRRLHADEGELVSGAPEQPLVGLVALGLDQRLLVHLEDGTSARTDFEVVFVVETASMAPIAKSIPRGRQH